MANHSLISICCSNILFPVPALISVLNVITVCIQILIQIPSHIHFLLSAYKPILTPIPTLNVFYALNSQNLQALLSAKIRCEQGPGSNPMGGYGKNGGDRGAGSNVMNMDNDYGY